MTTKMLQFGFDNAHEPNYLLDKFKEELGTQIDLINDPMNRNFEKMPEMSREKLRPRFDQYYSKEFLIQSTADHLNEQMRKENKKRRSQ